LWLVEALFVVEILMMALIAKYEIFIDMSIPIMCLMAYMMQFYALIRI
jgi:hypothetical protein